MITLVFFYFHQFQDELNAAKSLVETHCIIGRSIANQSFMEEKFDRFSSSGQSDNNEFEGFLPPFPNAKHRKKGRMSPAYSKPTVSTSTALGSESLRFPSGTLRREMRESELEFERSKPEFECENEQLRKTNVKLQNERKQDQETITELRTENQQLNAKIHSLYERILEQKGK